MTFWPVLLLAAGPTSAGFVPELSEAVVYEANLRALGPNAGFDALRVRLPQIKALGVNVLWLMPVQPVGKIRSAGGLGSPYAVADFRAVNAEFGDAPALRRLIGDAHELRLAVILDWVADHTSWDHPWIKVHPDWYLHSANGEISIPPGTGWNDVAALDYRNASMRTEMTREMQSWITNFDVDGFRCDSADRMPPEFWRDTITTLRASTPKRLMMLAEGFRADDYSQGFDLTYGWDFCSRLRDVFAGKPATDIAASAAFEAKDVPIGARRLRFVTNHDISAWEGSTKEFYKTDEGLRTAFAIAALYGGTPLVYTGQEVAWGGRIPIFEQCSIDWSRNGADSRWLAQLLVLRSGHAAFRSGMVTDRSSRDVVLFTRESATDVGLVLANVRDRSVKVDIPNGLRGRWRDGQGDRDLSVGSSVTLPPYGRLILVKTTPGGSQRLR